MFDSLETHQDAHLKTHLSTDRKDGELSPSRLLETHSKNRSCESGHRLGMEKSHWLNSILGLHQE